MTYFRKNEGNIENVLLIPGSGGVFEVAVNGEKIHSKRETGKFPDHDEIIREIERK